MFPAAIHAIAVTRPKAFIIENVRGLLRPLFREYFEYICLRLEMPLETARRHEDWPTHLSRLRRLARRRGTGDLCYRVQANIADAADYGVPQRRHRVFLVGYRHDIECDWHFPDPTHSRSALLHDQWVSFEYWHRHRIKQVGRPFDRDVSAIERLTEVERSTLGSSWLTVRDALQGLPEPQESESRGFLNHRLQSGARSYPKHTGSPLDKPAKTLKAGGHGVPGGENMLVMPDGSVRYFTVRESARLQTFPDDYELHGSWGDAMRQLGNAVPVLLAHQVAASVRDALRSLDGSHARAQTGWRALA